MAARLVFSRALSTTIRSRPYTSSFFRPLIPNTPLPSAHFRFTPTFRKSWSPPPTSLSLSSQIRQFSSSARRSQRHRFTSFLDDIPHDFIVWGILGINGAVFAMWYLAEQQFKSGDPSAYRWMRENFTMSLRNVTSSRVWCLVTSCFSHSGTAHILFNGLTFYFMAPAVLRILGSRSFIALYMGGAIFANLLSTTYNNVFKKRDIESCGASAAIYAVISFLACVAPRTSFLIYGIVPVPAWLWVSGMFAFDAWSSIVDRRTTTDTAGHIGGLVAGVGYYFARRFGIRF